MGRSHSHLKSASQILNEYQGEEPFANFLKKYFQQNKKYGSRDRKNVSHLCYCHFRLGKALLQISTEERILIGLFLCSTAPNQMLQELKPEWNVKAAATLSDKLLVINSSLLFEAVFPWKGQLSEGIEHEKFSQSFLIQPDLFIRLRPGYATEVKTKLTEHGTKFAEMSSTCLSLPNASKIEDILELDKEAVVQDYTSQQTGLFLIKSNFFPGSSSGQNSDRPKVWDCCAASGGKSLMLYDLDPDIELTVSDVRESILANLKKRFAKAGVKNYKSFVADLTLPDLKHQTSNFELIICDAPCTGSGTWSRTPEQLYWFDEKKVEQYSVLQKSIVSNIFSHLKSNGLLLYITCSVFKKENEETVDFIINNFGCQLIKMELLKGYEIKADTMFVALLQNNL